LISAGLFENFSFPVASFLYPDVFSGRFGDLENLFRNSESNNQLFMTPAETSRPFSAQDEKEFVEQTIIQFASATAHRDIYSMLYLLHENFQALVVDEETLVSSRTT
jgi:hypothetical protein